jgi:hypothetical protein
MCDNNVLEDELHKRPVCENDLRRVFGILSTVAPSTVCARMAQASNNNAVQNNLIVFSTQQTENMFWVDHRIAGNKTTRMSS